MENYEVLYNLLKKHQVFKQDELDAYVHALVDIKESMDKIYNIFLENILNNEDSSKDEILNNLWDIREEFRHIEYHIKDAKLTDT